MVHIQLHKMKKVVLFWNADESIQAGAVKILVHLDEIADYIIDFQRKEEK